MLISELIKELKEYQDAYGDVPVYRTIATERAGHKMGASIIGMVYSQNVVNCWSEPVQGGLCLED